MTTTNKTTADWRAADARHHLHPFSDNKALGEHGVRVIERGEGVYVVDTEGNRILDGMSGLWCVNMGYGQQTLIDAATRQLQQLPFYNTFFQTSHPAVITAAEAIANVAPAGFKQVFFTGSGSEGNDTQLRLVRRYWDVKGQPQRRIVIARQNAYHGSTVAAGALGGMSGMHEQIGGIVSGIEHIGQPHIWEHRNADGSLPDEVEFGRRAAGWLEERILQLGAENVAAFIGEPVQGAGGVIVPPKGYWPEIERICRKYELLLISDEVICGFGRTGQMFGCQTLGYRPDLITFAKGVTSGYIPMGGVLVGERVQQALADGGEFEHGFTYSGHPVASAVAVANLQLMQQLGTVQRVREELAPHLALRLAELGDHPLVGHVQQQGLMAALQLTRNGHSNEAFGDVPVGYTCRAHCFSNGVISRAVGTRMVIAPPLVITTAEIDLLAERLRRALDLTLADAQRNGWLGSAA